MMFDTLLHTLKQYKLNTVDRRFLVAVSGGIDSIVLLHLLLTIREQTGFYIHVATLDHGLRGTLGADDVQFVQKLCHDWLVPVDVGKVDTGAIVKSRKIGVEAAARQARYDFLATVAKKLDIEVIMTAHHADDQAETILMNILRGTGLNGLQGMRPLTRLPHYPELTIFRPMLGISREEINKYAESNYLTYRLDETNANTEFLRNKVRLKVLPQLQTINPQVQTALIRLSNAAKSDADYLNTRFRQETQPFINYTKNWVKIDKSAFHRWHPAIQIRSLRHSISHIAPEADVGYKNLNTALEIIEADNVGAIAEFAGKVQLRIDYDNLFIEHHESASELMQFPTDLKLPIKVGENFESPDGLWTLRLALESNGSHGAELCVPQNAEFVLRTRRSGDRIQPKGLNGHSQKLKKWFIDHKVARIERDRIPLLLVNQQIGVIFFLNQCYVTESYVTPQLNCIVVYVFTTSKINP